MGFGKIFGESWRDYKRNFKAIFWLMFIFYLIPLFLFTFVPVFLGFDIEQGFSGGVVGLLVVLGLVLFFSGLFYNLGIMAGSLFKKKFSFSDCIGYAKKFYWGYFGFIILLFIYMAGLFLLLIIPGIIFMIFWAFSPYVFVYERKGIHGSLRRSFQIVRKRWWKTFGYTVLLILIVLAIGFGAGLILAVFSFFLGSTIYAIIDFLVSSAVSFVMTTLMILFFKNFYFEMRKSVVRK